MVNRRKTGGMSKGTKRQFASKVSTKAVDVNLRKRDFISKGVNNYNIKPEPFPRVLLTRAKFVENWQVTIPGYGLSEARSYRINSIYRPPFTAPATTVCGYAQLAAIYNKYLVLGAKVTVSFSDPTVDGIRVGVALRQASNGPCDAITLQTLANYSGTYISALNNTGSQKKEFNFFIKPWSLIGISKLEYMANSSIYASGIATNPSSPAYIDVFAVQDDASKASTQTVNALVKIIYYVKLFERAQLNQS
jgi:hypothetical protein